MTRIGLTALIIATLSACSSAAPPSATTGEVVSSALATPERTEDATVEPTVAPTTASEEPAEAIAADELVLSASDLPADLGFEQGIDREVTPDLWEDLFGADYRAQLEDRGFVSGHQRSFKGAGGIVTAGSSSYVFGDAEDARSFQEWLSGPEWSGGCSESFDAGGVIGDVSSAVLCPGSPGVSADRAVISFVQDRVVIELDLSGTIPGDAGPRLDLLADLARALEEKIPG